jgi:acyl carrier protein
MTIHERIRHFIVTNFFVPDPAQLADETSLLGEGIIDSTGVLEVLHFVETQFSIKVPDEEIVPDNFDGIARIVRFVERQLAKRPASGAALAE